MKKFAYRIVKEFHEASFRVKIYEKFLDKIFHTKGSNFENYLTNAIKFIVTKSKEIRKLVRICKFPLKKHLSEFILKKNFTKFASHILNRFFLKGVFTDFLPL